MDIHMTPCASSNVKAHGHDAKTSTLALQFATGVYHYPGVTTEVYDSLKAAPSIGSFVAKTIRPNYSGIPAKTAIGPTDI